MACAATAEVNSSRTTSAIALPERQRPSVAMRVGAVNSLSTGSTPRPTARCSCPSVASALSVTETTAAVCCTSTTTTRLVLFARCSARHVTPDSATSETDPTSSAGQPSTSTTTVRPDDLAEHEPPASAAPSQLVHRDRPHDPGARPHLPMPRLQPLHHQRMPSLIDRRRPRRRPTPPRPLHRLPRTPHRHARRRRPRPRTNTTTTTRTAPIKGGG
jgi:hypothetical protein